VSETVPEDEGEAAAPRWLVEDLGALLSSDPFVAHRPQLDVAGTWGIGSSVCTDDAWFLKYGTQLRALPSKAAPFGYQPLRPDLRQRNRVLLFSDVHVHPPDETCAVEEVWPKVGLRSHDQIRALVCDGPVMLAWVGGFREEPFSSREHQLFSSLVPAIRRALRSRRKLLDAGLARAGLVAALETLACPAFIVNGSGHVAFANKTAVDLFEHAPRDTVHKLRGVLDTRGRPGTATRVALSGARDHFLVLFQDASPVQEARLNAASGRWGLTLREREVLGRVVLGDSNKEIAGRLQCHEGNVERHVTSLLRKARCDGRGRLVARFWTF
jgi:DNA-binding CsgD family transcriptional regulator